MLKTLFLAAVVLTSVFAAAEAPGPKASTMIGDVDGNGAITAIDATLINLYLLLGADAEALIALLPEDIPGFYAEAADVNLSSGITSIDATLLNLGILMGLETLNMHLQSIGQPLSHAGEPLPE